MYKALIYRWCAAAQRVCISESDTALHPQPLLFMCSWLRPCCAGLSRSVQFSRSVVFDSLRPHGLQHARPPCPSPIPGVYPNSRPSSRWCHPAISSSVVPCLVAQSCPALCDPMDSRLPGSSVRGDSPGKNSGVGCRALLMTQARLFNFS